MWPHAHANTGKVLFQIQVKYEEPPFILTYRRDVTALGPEGPFLSLFDLWKIYELSFQYQQIVKRIRLIRKFITEQASQC